MSERDAAETRVDFEAAYARAFQRFRARERDARPRGRDRAQDVPTRDRILALLAARPMTAAQLPAALGVTPSTVFYHLHRLAAAGRIVEVAHDGRGALWRAVMT